MNLLLRSSAWSPMGRTWRSREQAVERLLQRRQGNDRAATGRVRSYLRLRGEAGTFLRAVVAKTDEQQVGHDVGVDPVRVAPQRTPGGGLIDPVRCGQDLRAVGDSEVGQDSFGSPKAAGMTSMSPRRPPGPHPCRQEPCDAVMRSRWPVPDQMAGRRAPFPASQESLGAGTPRPGSAPRCTPSTAGGPTPCGPHPCRRAARTAAARPGRARSGAGAPSCPGCRR